MSKRQDKIAAAIKSGDDRTAEKLLLQEVRQSEKRVLPGPEYHVPYVDYESLAKIYRKRKSYKEEVDILKRYFRAENRMGPPSGPPGERLRRAIALLSKANGPELPVEYTDKRYAIFDLNTSRVIPSGACDLLSYRPLGISCAAVLESAEDHANIWYSGDEFGKPAAQMSKLDLQEVVHYLEDLAAKNVRLVTWNGLGFDFDILGEESGLIDRCRFLALKHLDLMFLEFCQKGYPVSLEMAMRAMFPEDGYEANDTEQMARRWQEGDHDFVTQDLRSKCAAIIRLVYECERRETLQWMTKKESIAGVRLENGLLSVEQALTLPAPDTTWMQNPMSRARYTDWLALD